MIPKKTEIFISDSAAKNSAFERLPEEIIVQILRLTSPNCFASLVLLNRRWRLASSQACLYIHQLLSCPSYYGTNKIPSCHGGDSTSLPWLRRLFAREIKRNLFEAYLRPTETTIRLISKSGSQFSASERESYNFSLSPQGHYILAYSSCQIHILDATGPDIIAIKGFKIIQRPVLATITDDGCKLALFYTSLHVYIYDLTNEKPRKSCVIVLDHTPRTIALSPNGSVLAVAYDSGIEVSSLNPTNLSTDRRSVKCYTVDSLSFSRDGTQMLGTTIFSQSPSTVVLTAPYFDTGASLPEDSISALWTTSILFPNGSRDYSHAVLLPSSSVEEANWAFTYSRDFETFRAVRIDDFRNSTNHSPGPGTKNSLESMLVPSSLPAANKFGELVASESSGSIWLHGIPEDLDSISDSQNGTNNFRETVAQTSLHEMTHHDRSIPFKPPNKHVEDVNKINQWQLLCDMARHTFAKGRNIAFMENLSKMAWVDSPKFLCGDRLIAVASSLDSHLLAEEESSSILDTEGRIMILDFNHSPVNGQKNNITIEVDMNEAQILDNENFNPETEANRVRMRNFTSQQDSCSHTIEQDSVDPPASLFQKNLIPQLTNQSDVVSLEEDAFDAPYSHNSPRSGSTLRRAATAAAVNRRLNPQLSTSSHTTEYRRSDERAAYPHESDADDWVPPPPPYSLKSKTELLNYIQESPSETDRPMSQGISDNNIPGTGTDMICEAQRTSIVMGNYLEEISSDVWAYNNGDMHSSEQTNIEGRESWTVDNGLSGDEFDDRYDVSPSRTPPLEFRQYNSASRDLDYISLQYSFDENTVTTSIPQPEPSIPTASQGSNLPNMLSLENTSSYEQLNAGIEESETTLVRSAHFEDLPLNDKSCLNSQRPQSINCQNTTSKYEIRGERLSLKLPFSNKIASVAKVLREQRPRLSRRLTAPDSVILDTSVIGKQSNLEINLTPASRYREHFSRPVNSPNQCQSSKLCENSPIPKHQSTQNLSPRLAHVPYSFSQIKLDQSSATLPLNYPSTKSSSLQNSLALQLRIENHRSQLIKPQSSSENLENIHNISSDILRTKSTSKPIGVSQHCENTASNPNQQKIQNTDNIVEVVSQNKLLNVDERKHADRNLEFRRKNCAIM